MTEELLIDNQAVDLNAGTAVTLNFKSNILGDVDAIESNYSQTISLPKTNHNRAVLDNPTAPSYSSTFRRTRHSAKYRRNGVEVIGDGYAVLLDSSDSYEIAIYWGIKAALTEWLDNDPSLRDLGWEPTGGVTTWNTYNGSSAVTAGRYVWAVYATGIRDRWYERLGIARYPFVAAWDLFSAICDNLGIAWNAGDTTEAAMTNAGIFLPTHNSADALVHGAESISMGNRGMTFSLSKSNWFTMSTETISINAFSYNVTENIIKTSYDGTARLEVYLSITVPIGTIDHAVMILGTLIFLKNGSQILSKSEYLSASQTITSDGVLTTYYPDISGTLTFDCEAGDEIGVIFATDSRSNNGECSIRDGSYINFMPPGEEEPIDLGDTFPASVNMPDISQLDFFKAICAMFGLYVMPDGDGLQIVTFESLTGNRTNAVDWSDKLVWGGVPCEPAKTAFSFGDWARRNWFRYKEDEDVEKDADGAIVIADETLEDEYEVIELPFSASDEATDPDFGVADCILPHYSWDGDEPTEDPDEISDDDLPDVDETELSPRIVRFEIEKSVVYARFAPDLTFGKLLQNYHATLTSLLQDMIVITEEFRLTEFDLLNLDYLKPVYLRQYGRYYGIVSIQTKDDNICEAELVQLPLPTE